MPKLSRDITHCVNGHEFTPENTGLKPNGFRYCRACQRVRAAASLYSRLSARSQSIQP